MASHSNRKRGRMIGDRQRIEYVGFELASGISIASMQIERDEFEPNMARQPIAFLRDQQAFPAGRAAAQKARLAPSHQR
jgi:hypothetical protein